MGILVYRIKLPFGVYQYAGILHTPFYDSPKSSNQLEAAKHLCLCFGMSSTCLSLSNLQLQGLRTPVDSSAETPSMSRGSLLSAHPIFLHPDTS